MRFKVREGFVIHHRRLVKVPGLVDGEETIEVQQSSFYAKQVVDFDAEEASEHAHKLEPFDKEAKAWLEGLAVTFDAPVAVTFDAPVAAAPAGASLEQLVALMAEAIKLAAAAPASAPADQGGASGG